MHMNLFPLVIYAPPAVAPNMYNLVSLKGKSKVRALILNK